jgi:hypothetical protein
VARSKSVSMGGFFVDHRSIPIEGAGGFRIGSNVTQKLGVEMLLRKRLDLAGLMVGQIVENDVNLPPVHNWRRLGKGSYGPAPESRSSHPPKTRPGAVAEPIQSDHVRDRGLELRIVPGQIAFQAMWAHIGLRQKPFKRCPC